MIAAVVLAVMLPLGRPAVPVDRPPVPFRLPEPPVRRVLPHEDKTRFRRRK